MQGIKKSMRYRFNLSKLEKIGANYSGIDDIEIIEKPKKSPEAIEKGVEGVEGEQHRKDGEGSDNSHDVRSGNNEAVKPENIRKEVGNIEDPTTAKSTKESEPSITSTSSTSSTPADKPEVEAPPPSY